MSENKSDTTKDSQDPGLDGQASGASEAAEPTAAVSDAELAAELNAKLSAELDDAEIANLFKLEKENKSLRDQLLRAQAELQNLHKRQAGELDKAYKFSTEKFARELLPVIDSLEKAIQPSGSEELPSALQPHLEGVQLTYKLLLNSLEKLQLTQINPLGASFDPNFHEAMTMLPSAAHSPGEIIEVIQKGYLLHERVIRAAMVVVAAAPKQ